MRIWVGVLTNTLVLAAGCGNVSNPAVDGSAPADGSSPADGAATPDGASFAPSQVNGYALHLRADAAEADESGVFEWNDMADAVNNQATQATDAQKPSLTLSNPNFNGEPTVDADPSGTVQWLEIDDHASLRTSSDGNMWFAVVQSNMAAASPDQYILTKWSSFGDEWVLQLKSGEPQLLIDNGQSAFDRAESATMINDGGAHVVEAWLDNVNGEIGIRVDGGPAVTAPLGAWSESAAKVRVFNVADASDGLDGSVAELIFYNQFTSQSDMTEIRGYLSARYDIGL